MSVMVVFYHRQLNRCARCGPPNLGPAHAGTTTTTTTTTTKQENKKNTHNNNNN